MTRVYAVACDGRGCEEITDWHRKQAAAIEQARADGWTLQSRGSARSERHFCSACSPLARVRR